MPFSTEGGWLPDVNVWIALVANRHEHHATARRWFESATQVACFWVAIRIPAHAELGMSADRFQG
jgi:hypothetical protein